MRLFAIGDIHGCFTALQTLVEKVPLTTQDQVITLGDYVDRGPDTRRVVEWVKDRTASGKCIPLRGNHEIMLLEALNGQMRMSDWIRFGGQETLDSYSPDSGKGRPDDVDLEHLRFLEQDLLPYYETESHIFVHASVDSRFSLKQQTDEALYWRRFEAITPSPSGKVIVCGHTSQRKTGLPLDHGYAVCIDTWACGSGWLTSLDVATGQFWQANQRGDFRTSDLSCLAL